MCKIVIAHCSAPWYFVYMCVFIPCIPKSNDFEIPNSNSVAPNTPDARAVNVTTDWDKITQFHSLCI